VVDDGIRFDHPDIAGNLRLDGYDFVTMQTLPACTSGSFTTSMDGDGPDPDPTIPVALAYNDGASCVSGVRATGAHGLHVAGTIGARAANGEGGVGIAWQVSIRPVRALGSHGSGTHYDIAQGILYAAGLPADGGAAGPVQAVSPARIINLSLAGTSGSSTLHNAVIAATNAGSLVVAAAGNENATAPYYPAAYPEALSVAAVAPSLDRASYSNQGSSVDIAAPGGQLTLGSDYGVWSLRWNFQLGTPIYDALQGTSMAAPHVSGIAALVLAASPGLTQAQLRARLVDHAMDIGPSGDDDDFGAGLVNAAASVRNGPTPSETYVRVYDARTGAVVSSIRTSTSGSYSLDQIPDGSYHVYAGQDENADGVTDGFDRRWGALGGSTSPESVSVAESSIESASFTIGYPQESEPNGSTASADPLPVGGYAYGSIASSSDVDLYRFTLAVATTVVIETDALVGSCGHADQVDTILRVLNGDGSQLAAHDDIDGGLDSRCSRIQMLLPAGSYYAEVTGFANDRGSYAVRIGEVS
jgi:subtilisin family serine protease